MKKLIFIFTVFLIHYAFANNGTQNKIDPCQSISESTQRLSCYDVLFNAKRETSTPLNTGEWIIREETSPIDDSKNVFIILEAETPIEIDYEEVIPELMIVCQENTTYLYVNYNTFLGMENIYSTTRVDSDKAESNKIWLISSNNQGIFYNTNRKKSVIDFIKELTTKKKFFIRITPYDGNPVDTTFILQGLDAAIKPLRAACSW